MQLEKEIDQKKFISDYHKLVVNVLFTGKWLEYSHRQFFKNFALTLQQYNVLRILRGAAPAAATVQYITNRMLDKSSNASRIVDKLEEKGLSSRTVCPANQRAVDVHITTAGQDMLQKIDLVFKVEQELAKVLTEDEAKMLNNLLDKIRNAKTLVLG